MAIDLSRAGSVLPHIYSEGQSTQAVSALERGVPSAPSTSSMFGEIGELGQIGDLGISEAIDDIGNFDTSGVIDSMANTAMSIGGSMLGIPSQAISAAKEAYDRLSSGQPIDSAAMDTLMSTVSSVGTQALSQALGAPMSVVSGLKDIAVAAFDPNSTTNVSNMTVNTAVQGVITAAAAAVGGIPGAIMASIVAPVAKESVKTGVIGDVTDTRTSEMARDAIEQEQMDTYGAGYLESIDQSREAAKEDTTMSIDGVKTSVANNATAMDSPISLGNLSSKYDYDPSTFGVAAQPSALSGLQATAASLQQKANELAQVDSFGFNDYDSVSAEMAQIAANNAAQAAAQEVKDTYGISGGSGGGYAGRGMDGGATEDNDDNSGGSDSGGVGGR